MTRTEIIELAKQCGLWSEYAGPIDRIEAFFHAAQALEREACAKVCDGLVMYGPVAEAQQRYNQAYWHCIEAIRNRGTK